MAGIPSSAPGFGNRSLGSVGPLKPDAAVSTTRPGLCPTLPNDNTKFLDGTGVFSTPGGGGGGTVIPSTNDFRLTLTSGTPVTVSDVLAAGTIYLSPYKGKFLATYDAAVWTLHSSAEVSLALTLTSGKVYDVFAYYTGAVIALELSAAWTNSTTRADALTQQDGVWVKSSDTSRRYLGTIYASAANQTEDSKKRRLVWNVANRVIRPLLASFTSTASWTYTTNVYRAANGDTTVGNTRVEIVIGLSEDPVRAFTQGFAGDTTAANHHTNIGIDSTTVGSASVWAGQNPVSNQLTADMQSQYRDYPGIGFHFIQWLEISTSGGTTTWFNSDAGSPKMYQMGLTGEVMG